MNQSVVVTENNDKKVDRPVETNGRTSQAPPSQAQKWLQSVNLICLAKQKYPNHKWLEMLDPWHSRNRDVEKGDRLQSSIHEFCSLVYQQQCMTDIRDRKERLLLIPKDQSNSIARILSFLRFYDITNFYFDLFQNKEFNSLSKRIKLQDLLKLGAVIDQSINDIGNVENATFMRNFGSMTKNLFFRFNQYIENLNPIHSLEEEHFSDAGVEICSKFLEDVNVYIREGQMSRITKRESIQFALIYLLHRLPPMIKPWNREIINKILVVLESPEPNSKKFYRLDPRQQIQYLQKSEPFYRRVYLLYREIVERNGKKLSGIQSFQTEVEITGHYIAYDQKQGFTIQHGKIQVIKEGSKQPLIFIDEAEPTKEDPSDFVEVVVPGFINLHTHTKFNFQGNVDFGSRFTYRFEWRQADFEGKYVIQLNRLMQFLCQHDKSPTKPHSVFDSVKKLECQEDNDKFRQNVKLYSQLQSVIGGCTTIFLECDYEKKKKYPNIIRSTIINDETSKNISSNDLYVIWRNQKNRDNLVLIWSQDFIKFVSSVITLEIEILLESQRNRINLHVHLAQGKSKSQVTECQFDNFCYDILCLQHFIRHIRQRITHFSIGRFKVECNSKMMNNLGVSIVTAASKDSKYRCQLQIKKLILKGSADTHYRTELKMEITEYNTKVEGQHILNNQQIVKTTLLENLTQTYKLQTMRGNLIIVHANGFHWKKDLHRYLMETYEPTICLSPYSNTYLYGGIRDFNWSEWLLHEKNKKYLKYLCLGTDWNPTGTENMLQQARHLIKLIRSANEPFKAYSTLFQMMTVNPARVTKMPLGQIKQNFYADFWIGRFPRQLVKNKESADDLIQYILRQFDYQNGIMKVYSRGEVVYSQNKHPGLQKITLFNELGKWFKNPKKAQEKNRHAQSFQDYVKRIRDILVTKFGAKTSLLFP